MRIHAAQRRVSLSVGELAAFRLGPDPDYGSGSRWRMALGGAWHESLHEESRATRPDIRTEVPLHAVLLHAGWRFELSGRIDQLIETDAPPPATDTKRRATKADETPRVADGSTAKVKIPHGTVNAAEKADKTPHLANDSVTNTDKSPHGADNIAPKTDETMSSAPTAASTFLIRELKTTAFPLPADEADLRRHYPHYFRQAALYAFGFAAQNALLPITQSTLLPTDQPAPSATAQADPSAPPQPVSPTTAQPTLPAPAQGAPPATAQPNAPTVVQSATGVSAELCFVNIHDGVRQSVHIDATQAQREAKNALERIVPFLEQRARTRLSSKNAPTHLPAFATYREGQPEALANLRTHLLTSPVTVFEAPTGFGKTGIALELALEQMRFGVFSRVIYLSGKSTGQHQVIRQLRQMNAQQQWRVFQLRSRREHTGQTLRERPARRSKPLERPQSELHWQDFGIFPEKLLDEQQADVDSLRMLAARTGLCPYELAKGCLPYADIWIGDYNYVFSARHRRVFFERPGFDPAQTLLIVDEAHNLASRVADNLSLSLSAAAAEAVALDLRLANAPFLLVQAWEAWTEFLQGIKPAGELPPEIYSEAATHLNRLCERIETVENEGFAPFTREALAEIPAQAQSLGQNTLPYLTWSPRHGQLNVTCLDAATAIGETLRRFGASLLMTATPGPHDVFGQSLGLEPQQMHFVPAPAPWRSDAYDVAIDATVDTRLRSRPQFYSKTADTIGRFALGANGPLTVFFPSYQYAQTVLKYLEALHPSLIVKVQPRAIDLGGQLTFIEESLLLSHVLFFVLGSSFSESIDHLGGRVDRAMIVGPALPEVTPVQDARLAQLEPLGREEAFARVYQIPALQKINQALGRLVRAPGQSARVLLHDRRFAQNSYRSLLDAEYQQAPVLRDEVSLAEWIDR